MPSESKPVAERIAAMMGRSTFVVGQGFGGLPTLTDHDVAAALALIRHRPEVLEGAPEVAPELLETYYGSTDRHRATLRSAYLRRHPLQLPVEAKLAPCRRMAASVAAQMVAGLSYSRRQHAEYAYICGVRLTTMRSEIERAYGWYANEAANAAEAFRAVVDSVRRRRLACSVGLPVGAPRKTIRANG